MFYCYGYVFLCWLQLLVVIVVVVVVVKVARITNALLSQLKAAGVTSLDQPSGANNSISMRYDGIVLIVFITYSNTFTYSLKNLQYLRCFVVCVLLYCDAVLLCCQQYAVVLCSNVLLCMYYF